MAVTIALVGMVDAAPAARATWETVVATWRSTYIERRQTETYLGRTLRKVA